MKRSRLHARTAILALCLAAGLGASAHASPPVDTRFTYQGRLSEDGVLGNGQYDLFFSVFNVSSGGAPLATFPVNNLQVTNGLFQTEVSFPQSVYSTGEKLWMQVEVRPGASVGSYSVLGNRQELLAVPFATRTLIPASLQTVYDAGHVAVANAGPLALTAPLDYSPVPGAADALMISHGMLRLGAGTSAFGSLMTSNSNVGPAPHTGYIGGVSYGGDCIAAWGEQGDSTSSLLSSNQAFLLSPSSAGNGGALRLGGTAANAQAIVLEGNGGNPYFSMTGLTDSVFFQPDAALADDTARLPDNSIWSHELGDEPGVASAVEGSSSVTLTGNFDELLTRTITAPGPGYVMVIGTLQLAVVHTVGSTDAASFGVSTVSGSLPVNQDCDVQWPSGLATGSYIYPITVHGLFSVPAGPITMHLLGHKLFGSGSFVINDMQLTCVYFPTNYGTVSSTLLGGPPDNMYHRAPMGVDDIQTEQQQSILNNLNRVQRENAEMRKRLEQIESLLRAEPKPEMTTSPKRTVSAGGER